ncbi:CAF17-like 4Fe-4S cluster assembly/insertion protein YgfZ [Roseobacter sp. CCS2]|uniref:CAF17-like 4Fe-4S cluster assembly/insertion protein YgfZ n=1 Tax=Roseobacter sp. CCS2 TaxID=391593 RepID=UPI0000F40544|nr:folate-binding protein YgfZ [Roseobacter sp. CCS2]EBA13134.1 aminomethyl transferase family protein [Roseobacter sp. CCS2]
MPERTVLSISGDDRMSFLQGLVTNDVTKADGAIIYTALLTPQGKYIADFFVIGQDDRLLIDVATSHAQTLGQRLTMYRLRAAVTIEQTDLVVSRGTSPKPEGAFADPRHDAMGWRAYGDTNISNDTDWDAVRVKHLIPQTGVELTDDTYVLEAGFEALNGVDFKKGCFVGQEIVARMKHKTTLKKGLAQVTIKGHAMPGDAITADGKPAGTLYTVSGDNALAFLRFDRADGLMQAGDATLTRLK